MSTAQPIDAFTIPKRTLRWIALAAAAIIALIILALLITALARSLSPTDPVAAAINPSEYQAVFLANGQVYFGKLTSPGGGFYDLRHVYYLAAQASPQSGHATSQGVFKLTSALQTPEDLMVINQRQVLFVENLQPAGKLTHLIKQLGG